MEYTPGDQQSKIESNKSTGSQDGGQSSCTPTYVPSGNNPGSKTLIKYDIVESLYIKEEIVQDEDVHQRGKHNLHSGRNKSEGKYVSSEVSSDNNSGAKTLIKYDIDEPLTVKEEIIQDQQTKSEWNKPTGSQDVGPSFCTSMQIPSDNNSGATTLIKYEIDEFLDIKEEVEDPERHQQIGQNLLSGKNQLDEKYVATVSCDNKSRVKTLIEFEYVETLEIKEEIIRAQENTEQKLDETLDRRAADITTIKKPRNSKKQKLRESKGEPKKKYTCKMCGRSYAQNCSLNKHIKFECGVTPQFRCELCGKKFKRKGEMNRHILYVHQKGSQMRHNCNNCSQSYSSLNSLHVHERTEHAGVRPQFICDYCGFQTKRKRYLPQHITSRHFHEINVPVPEPKHKYDCEKCARSYTQKHHLTHHTKFECGVMPQFKCEFCGKQFKRKNNMNRHIRCVHQKASQMRHNCNKCSRTYSSVGCLRRHKRLEHAVVKPQFICEFCGFKVKLKYQLSKHITSHLNA